MGDEEISSEAADLEADVPVKVVALAGVQVGEQATAAQVDQLLVAQPLQLRHGAVVCQVQIVNDHVPLVVSGHVLRLGGGEPLMRQEALVEEPLFAGW